MTTTGWLHLLSMLYLSGAICLAWSINQSRSPRTILKETARRWLKFMGLTGAIALAAVLLSL